MARNGFMIMWFLSSMIATSSSARWHTLLDDSFDDGAASWTYAGATNNAGNPFFMYDAAESNIAAVWAQTNFYLASPAGDTGIPSSFSHALPLNLDDQDTFRVRATLKLEPGSVNDTTEIYQIANMGVYGLSAMGPDRTQSDNWSFNSYTNRDGSDFVDFCYFINNAWGGPNITAVIGAHIDGPDGYYTTGTNYTQTAMVEDHWLPEGTNLYIELVYHGGATSDLSRCAQSIIYTDATRTNVLYVNNVAMLYTTQAFPEHNRFTATHFAFYNYVGAPWGDIGGEGAGTLDDVQVELWVDEGDLLASQINESGIVFSWASVSGETYFVMSSSDLVSGLWTTSATVVAQGDVITTTGTVENSVASYRLISE